MEQIEEWEQQMGRQFLVGGLRFNDYVRLQWESYKTQKENDRIQRVRYFDVSLSFKNSC